MELEINETMLWLEQSGWQFGYPKLAHYAHQAIPKEIQHHFTYTIHISLPTEAARTHLFREDVTMYGWEDIEWGMRLRDAGVSLIYEPDACAYHHHHISEEQSLERMRTLGRSAVHMKDIAPQVDCLPTGWKRWAYHVAALLPTMAGRHRKAFLEGIREN